MDSDTPLVVNVEATVPWIVLATGGLRSGQIAAAAKKQDDDETSLIRILPIELQQAALLRSQRGELVGSIDKVSERMAHAMRFRLFRGTVPAQGQPLLFQVLRWCKRYIGERRQKRNNVVLDNRHLYVSDTSVFSVEFRHLDENAERGLVGVISTSTPTSITPGVNQVVIYVDNEGTPCSYSIDGAES